MRTHGRRKDVARNIQDNQGTCLVKCGDAQIQWEIGKKGQQHEWRISVWNTEVEQGYGDIQNIKGYILSEVQ